MSTTEVPAEVLQNGDAASEEENGNVDMSALEGLEDASKPIRIIRKAKRVHRNNSGGDASTETSSVPHDSARLPFSKNSRKSREGKGRGAPKKGGAGGKGTWGTPGDELMADPSCRDANDPNYDSDSQDEVVIEQIAPVVTAEEFDKIVEPIFKEYFDHGSTAEVIASLEELNISKMKPRAVELIVSMSLDRKASHRELTSVLVSDMYGKTLEPKDIPQGFDNLLKALPELTIDTPEAPSLLGKFIARAVADDCLPPKYIYSYKGRLETPVAQAAMEKAELLLGQKHGIVRLDNIWGTGGGIRPVKYIIKQMVLLLKEYLSSSDIAEATRCLQELEVPHFHHELVYEGCVMVLEDGSERSAKRMCALFKSLADAVIISPKQLSQGFLRVFDNLPDISLDVPTAYSLMERFSEMCVNEKVITEAVFKELPQRGRKRFVSEGDGGQVKPAAL